MGMGERPPRCSTHSCGGTGTTSTTRVFVQALVQVLTTAADLWSSNVRFGVWSDANTGLFVVYNDIQGLGIARPSGAGRTLTVKYNYLFDLID